MEQYIQNKRDIFTKIVKESTFTDKVASVSIILYSFGFLINSIFLKSFGSIDIPIVKSDFIATGLSFTVITLAFIVLSLLYFVIRDLKILRGRPRKGIKRSCLIVINYVLVLILFSMFITAEEWRQPFIIYENHSVLLKNIFLIYFCAILVGIVLISIFEEGCPSLSDCARWVLLGVPGMPCCEAV